MQTSDILKTIYNYYPRDLDWDNIEIITNSPEYINRLRKCEEARLNCTNWNNFKKELKKYASKEYNDDIYDYSTLGSVPCYHATIGFGESCHKTITVLISVITPLWAYRIIDFNRDETRYRYLGEDECKSAMMIKSLIEKYFPNYELVGEDQHQIVIPNIATAFEVSPTIFQAVFTNNDN